VLLGWMGLGGVWLGGVRLVLSMQGPLTHTYQQGEGAKQTGSLAQAVSIQLCGTYQASNNLGTECAVHTHACVLCCAVPRTCLLNMALYAALPAACLPGTSGASQGTFGWITGRERDGGCRPA
jgi:hypothetical protein